MDLDSLTELTSPSSAIVSLYVNRPDGPSGPLLSDLAKQLRSRADELSRDAALSVRDDAGRIAGLDGTVDAGAAPAYAVFASSTDRLWRVEPVPERVWNVVTVGSRPYLRPLRATHAPRRVGIVVADRARASLFRFEAGEVLELAPPVEGDPGKPDFGGFEGYEEHGARARAEEEAARVWRRAAALLFDAHRERPFDSLLIGGHKEHLDEVVAALHPYLRDLPLERFVVDPHTLTTADLRDRAADHVARRLRAEDDALTAELVEVLGRGGDAVAGTARVLEAANAKAIDRMVVSGTFARPGAACRRCGWLHRTAEVCEVCGSAMEPVGDVVAEAMEAVLAAGGTVRQVRVASALDASGVGAFLRFPV